MKKSVIFYYKLFFAGGTEHSILNLVKKIYKEFNILVAYDDDETSGIVLDEISKYSKVVNLNEVSNIEADVCIWCSQLRQGPFSEISKKIKANRYLYWCHSLFFETFPDFEFDDELMERMEKFICVSETVKKDIVNKYSFLESKCEVIENYLDVKEILDKSKENIDVEIDDNTLNIISVSRLAKDKRFWQNEDVV